MHKSGPLKMRTDEERPPSFGRSESQGFIFVPSVCVTQKPCRLMFTPTSLSVNPMSGHMVLLDDEVSMALRNSTLNCWYKLWTRRSSSRLHVSTMFTVRGEAWQNGREKAPAAMLCKAIAASLASPSSLLLFQILENGREIQRLRLLWLCGC